jgi:hypothetical protein
MAIEPDQHLLCTVAATLTVASLGATNLGTNAAMTVLRYRQILAEISQGGGLLRAAPQPGQM